MCTAPSLALCSTSGSGKLHSHPSAPCFSSLFACNDCTNPQYTNTSLGHLPEVPGITFLPSLAVIAEGKEHLQRHLKAQSSWEVLGCLCKPFPTASACSRTSAAMRWSPEVHIKISGKKFQGAKKNKQSLKQMWTICTLLPQLSHTRPSATRQKSCTTAGTQVQQVCSWRLSENTEMQTPRASIQSKILWSDALSLNLA